METLARLASLPLFAHFAPPQLERLAEVTRQVRLAPGAWLFREGDSSAQAYIVHSGAVHVERQTPYGRYQLATLGPGELFGEATFVDRQKRSGDVVAAAATELLCLDPEVLDPLAEEDQRLTLALYWSFWKSLSHKLRVTNELLTRFFSQGGKPPPSAAPVQRDPTGEFRIDMAAKRSLFQEQKLSNLEINFLASLSHERKLRPGAVVFREGEPGDAMYVVLEGRVMISKFIPGAGEEALAFLERGDYFGEMALIDQLPRSADAKADDTGAVVLAIPRNVVEGLLDTRKVSSLRLLRILCGLVAKRLREIDEKIVGWFILAGGGGADGRP